MNAAVVKAFDVPPAYGEFADPVAREGGVDNPATGGGAAQLAAGVSGERLWQRIAGADTSGRLRNSSRQR